jgi:hypothetical protein
MFMKLYNNANIFCWIAPYPLDCINSPENNGVSTCEHGDNAYIYRIAFYFMWLWTAVIVVVVCMVMVFWTARRQRQTMRKWDPITNMATESKSLFSSGDQTIVQAVAVQSCLYISAFLLTAIFPSLLHVCQAKMNRCTTTFYPSILMTVTFFPLQGFYNFFIHMRPRFNTARKDHPGWNLLIQTLCSTLGRTLGCSMLTNDQDCTFLNLEGSQQSTTSNSTPCSYKTTMSWFIIRTGVLPNKDEEEEQLSRHE